MKSFAVAAVILGALGTLAIVLSKAAPWEAPAGTGPGALLVVLFAVSPYFPLAWGAAIARTPLAAGLALAGSVVASVFGLGVYVDALFVKGAALHALVFLAVPPVQWGIALVTLVAVAVVRRRAAPKVRGCPE
jgi:hypothetical protein